METEDWFPGLCRIKKRITMKNVIKLLAAFIVAFWMTTANAKFHMEFDVSPKILGEKVFDTLKLSDVPLQNERKADFLNSFRALFPIEKYAFKTEQNGPNIVLRSEASVSTYTGIMSVYGNPETKKFGTSFFENVPSDVDMAFDANIKTDILINNVLEMEESLGFSVIVRMFLSKKLNTSTITVGEIIRKLSGRLQFAVCVDEEVFFIRIIPDEKPDPGLSNLLRTEAVFADPGLRGNLFITQTETSVTICNNMEWWNKAEKRIADTETFQSYSDFFPEKAKAHGWIWYGSLDDAVNNIGYRPEKFKEVVDVWATTAPIFGGFKLEENKVSSVSLTKSEGFSEVIGRQILGALLAK